MRIWRRLLRAETAIAEGAETVAGVDEAGRGPLAGPVVAAAVILDRAVRWDGIDEIPGITVQQRTVIDGDARMLSIAAASVVAKVVRDRIMTHLDRVWPAYGFARHKGYSTPEHLDVLKRLGPCPIHRYSWTRIRVQELPLFEDAPQV